MAAGDRKLQITGVQITRGNPVFCMADWQYKVEAAGGVDHVVRGGTTTLSLGAPAAARAMTLLEIEQAALAAVAADPQAPPRDTTT